MVTQEERNQRRLIQEQRDAQALAHAKKWAETATDQEKAELEATRTSMAQFFRDHD